MSPELSSLIDGLAEDVKPQVEQIEKSLPTTKNHYGDYMSLLSNFKDNKTLALMMLALIRAGANRQGVHDAYKIINGS